MVDANGTYLRTGSGLWARGKKLVTPSGSLMPTGTLVKDGITWNQIFAEDFLTDVPIGGFIPKQNDPASGTLNQGGAADAAYGSKLSVYPTGFGAAATGKSRPEQVLSVSNSCLTYNFNVNAAGENAAATVRFLAGTYAYNGAVAGYYIDPAKGARIEIRFQLENDFMLTGWGGVAQMIANGTDWGAKHGELDFLEGSFFGYAPHGMESNWHPEQGFDETIQWSNTIWGNGWHTAVAEWVPVGHSVEPTGRETVYQDGVLINQTRSRVSTSPRGLFGFQTGCGTNNVSPPAAGVAYSNSGGSGVYPANGGTRGKMKVDYVSIWQPAA